MTPSNRKTKGKKFEEKIADQIHNALIENISEYKILYESVGNNNLKPNRDTSSGNFLTSDGDIDLGIAKKYFPFSCECKHWKVLDLSINSLLKGQIGSLIKVWTDQALPRAKLTNLQPLIIFRANRTEDFVFFDKQYDFVPTKKYIKIDDWIICLFSDFLEHIISISNKK